MLEIASFEEEASDTFLKLNIIIKVLFKQRIDEEDEAIDWLKTL